MHGFSSHPVLRRTVISNPDGKILFPAPPAILDNSPDNSLREVPALNQHGPAIRAEFAKNQLLRTANDSQIPGMDR